MDQQYQSQNPNPNPNPGQNQGQPNMSGGSVDQDKGVTYLSYIGILFLVPMLAKKDSKFAQFHAKQGLVLTIGWFISSFLYVFAGLGALIQLAILVLSIMGLVNVSKGQTKDLPLVGSLAKKLHF
ncbi:MAG: hypothetical protein U1C49_01220 [Candidatus Andersenbacteria bacterium]|nr:hypothetical protein [bacterium]MDZ4225446.1 hypothetical protein [Candidatus Andersenbacteria bacterium]